MLYRTKLSLAVSAAFGAGLAGMAPGVAACSNEAWAAASSVASNSAGNAAVVDSGVAFLAITSSTSVTQVLSGGDEVALAPHAAATVTVSTVAVSGTRRRRHPPPLPPLGGPGTMGPGFIGGAGASELAMEVVKEGGCAVRTAGAARRVGTA